MNSPCATCWQRHGRGPPRFSRARRTTRGLWHDCAYFHYFEYYRLAAYLALRTKERIGVVVGCERFSELFDEKYYAQLPGGTWRILVAYLRMT